MDQVIREFVNILHSKQGESLDLGLWLQLFAFGRGYLVVFIDEGSVKLTPLDVIGEVTFSQKFGLMDAGKESEALLQIKHSAAMASWSNQIPWLSKIVNVINLYFRTQFMANARNGSIRQFTVQQVESRILRGSHHRDMLAGFLEVNKASPDTFDSAAIISMASSNVNAGSDTTAISLRAMFYYLIQNPRCMQTLLEEILRVTAGSAQDDVVTYEQALNMPYLQAVMNEALRMHSIVGQSLPRVVPKEGLVVGQYSLPAGVSSFLNLPLSFKQRLTDLDNCGN